MKTGTITTALVAVLLTACATRGSAVKPTFSVRDFGAKGDGTTLDTKAIQDALDTCDKAGGEIVVLPKGTYLSGAIFMKSNTTLRIEKDAVLKGSDNLKDYPFIDYARFAGTVQKCSASLINAKDARNVAITGRGEVAGSGAGTSRRPPGPRVIEFISCEDVLIENIKCAGSGELKIETVRGLVIKNVRNDKSDNAVRLKDVEKKK